ncbi:YdcF family protein [Roseomonas elaeocarpi]|uniref:ElyC/SanA/YdcF family protein n=1 Tax=Roseomonas elaeocarpi TaxID=907779 RepID=A0ABV6JZ82_9PROT
MRRVSMLRNSLRRSVTLLTLAALLVLGAGYAWYLDASGRPRPAATPETMGIAVLTGGPDRVETGLRLAAQHRAARLIISGAGASTDLAALTREAGMEPFAFLGRTTVGRDARSTRGNAREVAAWALAGDIRSITVVTAGFHMPRALLELRRALPVAELVPYAVEPHRARLPAMLREYFKLVGAWMGLSAYGSTEPAPLDEEGPAIQPPEDGDDTPAVPGMEGASGAGAPAPPAVPGTLPAPTSSMPPPSTPASSILAPSTPVPSTPASSAPTSSTPAASAPASPTPASPALAPSAPALSAPLSEPSR